MATPIGSLIVEIAANSAVFRSELERARRLHQRRGELVGHQVVNEVPQRRPHCGAREDE